MTIFCKFFRQVFIKVQRGKVSIIFSEIFFYFLLEDLAGFGSHIVVYVYSPPPAPYVATHHYHHESN